MLRGRMLLRELLWTILAVIVTAYTPLSDGSLKRIPSAGVDFDIHSGSLLSPILVPRVPGTDGIASVQQHFVNWFSTNLPKWKISFQNSTSTTPATHDTQIPFINIIITRDPPWARAEDVARLALVAHYDSKLNPGGFIGATDSAAPCAMIMHAARSVDEALTKKWEAMEADGSAGLGSEQGVQILFLDGEEAFVAWTDTDSLYGSRSLAETWEQTRNPGLSTFHTPISQISLFFLLDLLGAANPRVPSYFPATHWAYKSLATIEQRMRSMSALQSHPNEPFLPEAEKLRANFAPRAVVSDDHLPFMARGVEVLHIIPSPFPRVWHTIDDDGPHLDGDTVQDWAKMVTAFVGEWMDLEGFFPTRKEAEARQEDMRRKAKRSVPIKKDELIV